jgi:hypothetical protein
MTDHITQLPDIASAKLPQTYEAAQRALAECSRIDECQQWADKAEALASYAKQADDDTLRKLADRIQARAIRRCGELLKQIMPARGARTDLGAAPTRGSAADAAGLSERQRKTALRVASIPEDEFERQVESDDPPTVTALAERGKQPKALVDIGDIPPADYARATEALGTLKRFADFCSRHEPARIAKAYQSHEIARLRECIATVDAWMDIFVVNLPE